MIYSQIQSRLKEAKKIAIISHISPDADAIWSLLGMRALVRDNFSNVTTSLFILDKLPSSSSFLKGYTEIQSIWNTDMQYDALFIMDCGDLKRTWLTPENIEQLWKDCSIINIDHHKDNNLDAGIHFIDEAASSTSQMLYELAECNKWEVKPLAATALLMWIYTDTWAFLHRNVTDKTFEIASKLVKNGASHADISEHLFKSFPYEFVVWLGTLMSRIQRFWNVAFCSMKWFEERQGKELKSVLVNWCNSMQWIDVACVITQGNWGIKWSLRTNSDAIDVANIASNFYGWWHQKAAGFWIEKWTVNESSITIESGTELSFSDFVDYIGLGVYTK